MANVFAFRAGRSIKNCDPQAVGEELERIRRDTGSITPEKVIEEAASDESPLHHAFEWDDTEAARQHRLSQARRLVTSIRIINSPVQTKVPAFVSVPAPEGRSYVPTAEALSDEQLRARVLMEIQQFVESMQRRYAHFREVADLLDGLKKQAG